MHNKVREAQEALSDSGRPDVELILGGTTLITPDDMLDLLLGNSSYIWWKFIQKMRIRKNWNAFSFFYGSPNYYLSADVADDNIVVGKG